MIVVSLLLILVAVTLLVLGLAGGSSALLIGSIVASLLAAVALVIGARQASAARRSATVTAGDARAARRRAPGDPDLEPEFDPRDAPLAGDEAFDDADRSAAYAAGRQDTEEYLAGPDATRRVRPDADLYDDAAAGRTSSGQAAGPAATRTAPEADADEDQEPAVVGGPGATDRARLQDPAGTEPPPPAAQAPPADAAAEYDDPDPDDPDDEPLPQAVRPADAVRVAGLDAEVVVVDGRPRYHLADCSHLAGRPTEGLPVAEAVELGFSPCGRCRPVERLVAAATRR